MGILWSAMGCYVSIVEYYVTLWGHNGDVMGVLWNDHGVQW